MYHHQVYPRKKTTSERIKVEEEKDVLTKVVEEVIRRQNQTDKKIEQIIKGKEDKLGRQQLMKEEQEKEILMMMT